MKKRISNNKTAVLISFLILILIAALTSNISILGKTNINIVLTEITSAASTNSTGSVSLCLNKAPVLNLFSPINTSSRELFIHHIHASDPDGQNVSFSINDSSLFELKTVNGTTAMINFTPTYPERGNYSFLIIIDDNSTCVHQ